MDKAMRFVWQDKAARIMKIIHGMLDKVEICQMDKEIYLPLEKKQI